MLREGAWAQVPLTEYCKRSTAQGERTLRLLTCEGRGVQMKCFSSFKDSCRVYFSFFSVSILRGFSCIHWILLSLSGQKWQTTLISPLLIEFPSPVVLLAMWTNGLGLAQGLDFQVASLPFNKSLLILVFCRFLLRYLHFSSNVKITFSALSGFTRRPVKQTLLHI